MHSHYEPYNRMLVSSLGLDWDDVARQSEATGNSTPGVYPDAAVLLERFMARDDVSMVVEFGSGSSTLFLARAASRYGKAFVSFEEDPHWLEVTLRLLAAYGQPCDLRPFDPRRFDPIGERIDGEPNVIFLDSKDRLATAENRIPLFSEADFVLVDDIETAYAVTPTVRYLADLGRTNLWIYNPVQRGDRNVLINAKDPLFQINDWVWTWRPVKTWP